MRIKKLRLTGFKSFVEPAELRIEPGLTGVVGPNGCGKSNLLEAIRWVMGESSAKSMRGAGMEDVIFAGTSTRPARDFAEVSITLDQQNAEGQGGEVEAEVVRRIERGAGSAYRVNGKDVRAKDISLLFADAATGAHSPALVSQGRISAIISAKPAERRQMLEEAAGISGLHVRRKDAEQKLRATETNLTRLDDLLADMEVRANALRRQARAAERYRLLSADIRIVEARLIFARWRDAAAAADLAKKEAAAAEQLVGVAAQAQQSAAADQAEAARRLGDARGLVQVARETENEIGHRLTAMKAEQDSIMRRIADLHERRQTLAADRDREDRLAIDAAAALEALDLEAKRLAASINAAEAERNLSEIRVATATEAVREIDVAMARAVAAQAAEQADLRVAEAASAAARQRARRAEAEAAKLEQELEALAGLDALEAALGRARAARQSSEEALNHSQQSLATAESARDAAAKLRDEAESQVAAARARQAALASEMKALQAANQGGGDRVLTKISVEPGYERALAAALGDDLDAPLGQSDKRGWMGAEIGAADPSFAEGLERLSAHVTAPPELARRLAQVAVAENDDSTIDLLVGQRLVTRTGQMRRWDGYVAKDSGAAAAERLIRANRLQMIERELPVVSADLDRANATLSAAAGEAQAARLMIEAARAKINELESSIRSAQREEDQALAAIDRQKAARKAIEDRLARAGAELDEAKVEVERAEAGLAELPSGEATAAEVMRLQSTGEAARSKLADIRSVAATLGQSISRDRARREAVLAEAKSWRSRSGDAAKRIEEMNARALQAETELASLAGRPASMDTDIAAIEAQAAELKAQVITAAAEEKSAEDSLRAVEQTVQAAGEALATAREARAGALARFENQEQRRIEMGRISGERFECPAPVLPSKAGFDADDVGTIETESSRLERLTAERERIGPVNLVAESELQTLEEVGATGQAEREELGHAINRLRGSIGSLNREGRARLMVAFEAVDRHFRRLFTTLFAGGEAHLALIDSDDPLEAGLEIMAQPPGKKLGSLTLLSGGEQALTAVALIFALFLTNPAPICVLDEVDAPLDDANIERFCDLLDRMTQETDTRYLIVTHNAVTMARMHRLFGVTMIERGISRLVSVDLGGAETLLAAE
jgi:chromosome segregation protein